MSNAHHWIEVLDAFFTVCGACNEHFEAAKAVTWDRLMEKHGGNSRPKEQAK